MAGVTVSFKGSQIASIQGTGSKTLKTGGKYCEGDIFIDYVKEGLTPTSQTYNQMNEKAALYIANVTYDPSDYTYSELSTYVVSTDYDKSKPSGAAVTLPSSGTLMVQEGEKCMSGAVSSGQNTIFNITPGHTGAYAVKNSSDNIVATGVLKPTGALRMINLNDAVNVRDLGGWACDGGTVKYGKLFRGSSLFRSGNTNAYDLAVLHDLLGIRRELDLRWDSAYAPDNDLPVTNSSLIGDDVEWKHINGAWYEITHADDCKAMLEYVMDSALNDIPLYFHCAGGADRTGTLALFIEAILGMSQSDIDKDYELTSFHSGIGSDAAARRRNETEWTGLVSAFSSYSGSSFRDKVVYWVLSLGITIDKINAFRAAMINGTPSTLNISAGNVSVTKSLSGVSTNNSAATTAKFQPYSADLTPDSGKAIASVQVLMDNVDITEQVFSGKKCIMRHFVILNLTNCTADNDRAKVVDGECYYCKLTPDTGYTLEGATITITMGGINVSNYYESGEIRIPKVTGAIVINATAAACAPAYTNQITQSKAAPGSSAIYNGTGYKDGYCYNSSYQEKANAGSFTTGYIPVQYGDVVRLYGNILSGSDNLRTIFYDASGTFLHEISTSGLYSASKPLSDNTYGFMKEHNNYENNVLTYFTVNESGIAYIKFSCKGTFVDGQTVITINEVM